MSKARKLFGIIMLLSVFTAACGKDKTEVTTVSEPSASVAVSTSQEKVETSTEISSETSSEASSVTSVREPGGADIVPATSSETSGSEGTGTSASSEVIATIPVKFVICNFCGVDIGMISTLDPLSKEQIDLGSLNAGTAMILNLEWPADATQFDMAVYNMAGELVSVSNIDITGVTSSVTITLSGDNNLESVETNIE